MQKVEGTSPQVA